MNSPVRKRLLIVVCLVGVIGLVIALFLLRAAGILPGGSGADQGPHPQSSSEKLLDKKGPADVFGIVKDEAGNPLQGAVVRAVQTTFELYTYDVREIARVETSEDGTYSLNGFAVDTRYRLAASAPGFLESASKAFRFKQKQTEIDFALKKALSAQDKEFTTRADEVETILREARAYLDEYESGRITYSILETSSPVKLSEKEIEKAMKNYEELLRKKGFPDDRIPVLLEDYRTVMEKQGRKTEWTHYGCLVEHIFDGQNFYTNVTYDEETRPPDVSELYNTKYVRDGKETVIQEFLRTKEDGRQEWSRAAEVGRGPGGPTSHNLNGPFERLFFNKEYLTWEGWELVGRGERDGVTVYTIENKTVPHFVHTVEIAPELGYAIVEHRQQRHTGSKTVYSWRYEDMTWDASAEMYYPANIIHESRGIADGGEERISRTTWTLEDVELDIDIPDKTFEVPFIEGLNVTDYRFDPSKRYTHEYPDKVEEYTRMLDEEVAAMKDESQ